MLGTTKSYHHFFCSRFLKTYFLDILFSTAHILSKYLIHTQAGESSCLDGAEQKISVSMFLIFGSYIRVFTEFQISGD